ncbi:MAG: SIMPL domain-containing protein, partial [Patescibacteria group bacterium]
QNQNTSRSNAIIDFLKKNGIQDKDIRTTNYSIQPQYQYDKRPPCPILSDESIPCYAGVNALPRIVGYQVHHSLEIRMRDLNNVDDMLQGVVSAGANQVGSILFAIEDEKAAMASARKQAIEDAQKKALVLARDLGVRITKIAGFSESGGGPIYYDRGYGSAQALEKGGMSAPQVEPGEQEVRSVVTIAYEFR